VRSWAEGDERAAATLRRVQHKRLGYVTGLFREAGFSPGEATARGHLLAVYLMSESAIHLDETLETRLRLLRRQVRSLTKPNATSAVSEGGRAATDAPRRQWAKISTGR